MNLSPSTWVAAKLMGGTHPYGALQPGDKFRFPKGDAIYVKVKGGWFHADYAGHPGKARYRTGSKTAVVKL